MAALPFDATDVSAYARHRAQPAPKSPAPESLVAQALAPQHHAPRRAAQQAPVSQPPVPQPSVPHAPLPGGRTRRRSRLMLSMVLGLAAVPLITAAHLSRPAPYGDHLTVHARVEEPDAAEPRLRITDRAVEAYDPQTGRTRWAYAREGHRPLSVLPVRGHAVTLWSDGLVTDTARRDGRAVRWHRAAPAAAAWLRTARARGGAGVLQWLAPGSRMLAVVTPYRIAAYRLADGDLRWVLPARRGCAFEPARSMRHGRALLVAQPCRSPAASWTAEVVAVDELGRIVPRRAPLANERPGGTGGRSSSAEGPEAAVRNNTASSGG